MDRECVPDFLPLADLELAELEALQANGSVEIGGKIFAMWSVDGTGVAWLHTRPVLGIPPESLPATRAADEYPVIHGVPAEIEP